MKRAFSLVELSIVLVILGLLVGGVLSGQSLIRASELRVVNTEFQRYAAATMSFRDKYFALPGDMPNATSFWGINGNSTTCKTTASTDKTTCDGNGDGMIETVDGGTTYSERFAAWKHLANAGLVEGSYTGVAGAGANLESIPGQNVPLSRLSNAGWTVSWRTSAHAVTWFATPSANFLLFGKVMATRSNWTPALTPAEAWNIDTKVDDGLPGSGRVYSQPQGGTQNPNCATTAVESTARYDLTLTSQECALVMFFGA